MGHDGASWRDHRLAAAAVRGVVAFGPFALSVAVGLAVGTALPARGTPPWWLAVLAVSIVSLRMADRLARRLLPLAVLLDLALLFPDTAPSRFKLALKTGSAKHVREHMAEAQRIGALGPSGGVDPDKAAATILTLVAALGAHHPDSRKHSERVRAYTELLAEELHLPTRDRHRLRWAALLHDIGKVDVPIEVLNGTGPLSDEGWRVIHRHPIDGARLAAPLREWLGPWAPTVEQHHERFDGTGYPAGLHGDQICMGARMVAVADSFEAMTARRSYQDPMPLDRARARLAELSGTQFDPAVVRAFLAVSLGRLRWAYGPLAWVAEVPALAALPTTVATGARVGVAALGVSVAVAAAGTAQPASDTAVAGVTFSRTAGVIAARAVAATTPTTAAPVIAPGPAPAVTTGPTTTSTTGAQATSTTTTLLPPVTVTVPTLPPVTMPPLPTVTIPELP
jgi:putative nucleotidyltransferase with HDIG domain